MANNCNDSVKSTKRECFLQVNNDRAMYFSITYNVAETLSSLHSTEFSG